MALSKRISSISLLSDVSPSDGAQILYNAFTKLYVLFFHLDTADLETPRVGILTSPAVRAWLTVPGNLSL